jgi:hypothetical protein
VAYDQPLHGAVYIKGRRAADLDMALVWYLGRGASVKGFCDTFVPQVPKNWQDVRCVPPVEDSR